MANGAPKSFFLSEELHHYMRAHSSDIDEIQRALIEETRETVGGLAIMQVAPEQGAFMAMLAAAIGAKQAIEVGTFTGYSALCVARALPADGRLLALDTSEEWTSIGRKYWQKAGVADRIDLRIGPAAETRIMSHRGSSNREGSTGTGRAQPNIGRPCMTHTAGTRIVPIG